jgi:hypothetical protein
MTAMFPGQNGFDTNITYEVQAADVKAMLKKLRLNFTKLIHLFRSGGARVLNGSGIDDDMSIDICKSILCLVYCVFTPLVTHR